jgi:hypothetical protein
MKKFFALVLIGYLTGPAAFAAKGTLATAGPFAGCVDGGGQLQCLCSGSYGNSSGDTICSSCGPGESCTYGLPGGGVGTGKIKRSFKKERISR